MSTDLFLFVCFLDRPRKVVPTFKLVFDPIWFALMALIDMAVGLKTPPFDFFLFVMMGVTPRNTTMRDIYRAVFPFVLADILATMVILLFPPIPPRGCPALLAAGRNKVIFKKWARGVSDIKLAIAEPMVCTPYKENP